MASYAKAAGALSVALVLASRVRTRPADPQAREPDPPPAAGVPPATPRPEPVPEQPPVPAIAQAAAAAASQPFWFNTSEQPVVQPPAPEPQPEPEPPAPEPEPAPDPEPPQPEPALDQPVLQPATAAARQLPPPEPAPIWDWAEAWSFGLEVKPERQQPRQPTRMPPRNSVRLRRGLFALTLGVVAVLGAALLSLQHSAPAGARPERPVPGHATAAASPGMQPRPSGFALQRIPSSYLNLYWRAAREYGLDWTMLAAVGQIESDHGRSAVAGIRSGTNAAGAAGPAQFLPHTWARYGVDADGRGTIDPYDPADAITAMAAYLKASGAPEDWHAALYTYNHSEAYVQIVVSLSQRFSGAAG